MEKSVLSNVQTRCGRWLLPIAVGLGLCLSSTAHAALFIKFDGVDGESVDEHHSRWSDIDYVSWGVTAESSGSGGGSGKGKATFQDLAWGQYLDKSFPTLFKYTASGKHFPDVTVDFTVDIQDTQAVYFQMNFREVFMSRLNLSARSDEPARFDGAFSYNYIGMTYSIFDETGRKTGEVKASYNLKTTETTGGVEDLLNVFALGMAGPTVTNVPTVPEPSTYALMLAGLGAVGLVARRRRSQSGC